MNRMLSPFLLLLAGVAAWMIVGVGPEPAPAQDMHVPDMQMDDHAHQHDMHEQGHAHDGMAGHEHISAGEPGDPAKPARTVAITMQDANGKMAFVPARIEVHQGEQIRFVLSNAGALEHEFVLGTKADNVAHAEMMKAMPAMRHDDPNAKQIASKGAGELLWKFTKAGEFEFACLIPGHYEAGMHGTVVVK